MDETTVKKLKQELKIHAHAVGIPDGSAKAFIDYAIPQIQQKLKNKSTITQKDLTRFTAQVLKQYNSDLAYVYKNHDKII